MIKIQVGECHMRIWNAASSSSSFVGTRILGIIGNQEQLFIRKRHDLLWRARILVDVAPSTSNATSAITMPIAQQEEYNDINTVDKHRASRRRVIN